MKPASPLAVGIDFHPHFTRRLILRAYSAKRARNLDISYSTLLLL